MTLVAVMGVVLTKVMVMNMIKVRNMMLVMVMQWYWSVWRCYDGDDDASIYGDGRDNVDAGDDKDSDNSKSVYYG